MVVVVVFVGAVGRAGLFLFVVSCLVLSLKRGRRGGAHREGKRLAPRQQQQRQQQQARYLWCDGFPRERRGDLVPGGAGGAEKQNAARRFLV